MKYLIFTSTLIIMSAMAGEATAACSGTQITNVASGTRETVKITFPAIGLTSGKSVSIAGLTYTANAAGATVGQVNNAFRNLSNGSTSSANATPGIGVYSGTFTGWTTANLTVNPRTFSSVSATGNVTNITASTTGAALTVVTTNGTGFPSLSTLLTNNTVCVGSPGNWEAQEYHKSNNDLIDYKLGPSDPVDPTSSVGSWGISGSGASARVDYTYGANVYHDAVWDHGNGTYSFCDQSSNETLASSIKSGQGSCP